MDKNKMEKDMQVVRAAFMKALKELNAEEAIILLKRRKPGEGFLTMESISVNNSPSDEFTNLAFAVAAMFQHFIQQWQRQGRIKGDFQITPDNPQEINGKDS